MRKARTIETCPTCKVEFIVAAIHTSGRTPYKVCPEGHETPVHHLAKSRQRAIVIAPQPVVPKVLQERPNHEMPRPGPNSSV